MASKFFDPRKIAATSLIVLMSLRLVIPGGLLSSALPASASPTGRSLLQEGVAYKLNLVSDPRHWPGAARSTHSSGTIYHLSKGDFLSKGWGKAHLSPYGRVQFLGGSSSFGEELMPTYSVDELPREIQVLFEHARAGDITPPDFCKALDQHGVSGSLKMLYTRDAFGLPLEAAKEIVIQNEYGSLESWGKEMGDAADGLSADSEPKKE